MHLRLPPWLLWQLLLPLVAFVLANLVLMSALAWLGVVVAIVAWRRPAWLAWRRPLLFLATSVLVATTVVAWMKSWTHVDCPWDLLAYGGRRDFHALLAALPADAPVGRCFPAGHASAGYAWTALYYFFLSTRPQWRWRGLGTGLGAAWSSASRNSCAARISCRTTRGR